MGPTLLNLSSIARAPYFKTERGDCPLTGYPFRFHKQQLLRRVPWQGKQGMCRRKDISVNCLIFNEND